MPTSRMTRRFDLFVGFVGRWDDSLYQTMILPVLSRDYTVTNRPFATNDVITRHREQD